MTKKFVVVKEVLLIIYMHGNYDVGEGMLLENILCIELCDFYVVITRHTDGRTDRRDFYAVIT